MKGLVAIVLGVALVGCGSSTGSGGGSSGVDSSKRLDSLTATEIAQFCDWTNAKLGGYGATMSCGGDITLEADANQAECVAGAPTTCAATVAQAEACANMMSCQNIIPEACAPLFACSSPNQ